MSIEKLRKLKVITDDILKDEKDDYIIYDRSASRFSYCLHCMGDFVMLTRGNREL